jgi:Domain of unknown function (DUF4124)
MARVRQTLAAGALGALAAMLAPHAAAQNTVWKCNDADGRPHYTNVKEEAKGTGCKVVSEGKVSTVPASAFQGATLAAPAAARGAAATPTPASFPRVDANTQKARDESRRKILEDELAAEQRSLGEARVRLAEQPVAGPEAQRKPLLDTVERHERNIAALQREIGNLR